jgi:hypothetical protein
MSKKEKAIYIESGESGGVAKAGENTGVKSSIGEMKKRGNSMYVINNVNEIYRRSIKAAMKKRMAIMSACEHGESESENGVINLA